MIDAFVDLVQERLADLAAAFTIPAREPVG
jgi:hypothetical protein